MREQNLNGQAPADCRGEPKKKTEVENKDEFR